MFLYEKFSDAYQKHEPFLQAMVEDYFEKLTHRGELRDRKPLSLKLSARPLENIFVVTIARDIIRITNRHLREKTVISRIQMDDDEYDVSQRFLKTEIKDITKAVMDEVLQNGSGKFLNAEDKLAVRMVVSNSLV